MERTSPLDKKLLYDLGAKLDVLEKSLGPDYAKLMDYAATLSEDSAEGKALVSAFGVAYKKCK